jgi:hypothetical protein
MAGAGAGRGSAAQRMRGLARAGEAGVRGAAAQGAGAAAQQFGMLGQAGQGRMGMMKSDKMGRLGFYQKSRGLDVAEKAADKQAAATRAANSGGKASGGEIYKEFKRKNGKIEGKGTETSDDIKAMLSDGEFVVNAKTVRGIGESMGARGKEDSRKKGAGFLYDLQTKYGDKKPVNKMLGGLEIAELGAHAAKSGLMGKKMQTVGEVAGSAVDAKKGMDAKKASDAKAVKQKKEMDELKAWKHKSEKASGAHPSKRAFEQMAKGGHINLGKGVKAKRKFREAIGWEADKIFDKKAEKDYKEGDTGYKNYKGEKSVTPVKLGRGGLLGSIGRIGLGAAKGFVMGGGPTGAMMGAAKAGISEKVSADKEKAQKKANIAGAEAQAAGQVAQAGKAMAADEVQLKHGGDVKKDHPHKKYLDDLDKFMAHHFPKGKKVDLDPGRKADKAIRAKKGSIEPMKFDKGGSAKKWKKPIPKKDWEDSGTFKDYLENYKKEYAEDPTEINPETGKPYPRYAYEDSFQEENAREDYIKRSWKELYGRKPNSLELESIRRIPGNFEKWQKKYSDHMKKGKYVRDPRTGEVVKGVRDLAPSTKEHTPETEKQFLKQKKEKESKYVAPQEIKDKVKQIVKKADKTKDIQKTRGETVLERLHKRNLKFPKKSPVPPKKIAGIPKTSLLFRRGDKGAEKAPSIPKEIRLEEILKKRVGPKPVDRVKQKKVAAQAKEEREKLANWRTTKKHLRGRAKEVEEVKKAEESLKEGPYRSKKALSPEKFKVRDITKVFEKKKEIAPKVKDKPFKQAFDEARDKGLTSFSWRGKKYGTDKKGEGGVHSQFDEKGHKAFKADQKAEAQAQTSKQAAKEHDERQADVRKEYKAKEAEKDDRSFLGKLGDVLYTGKTGAWGSKKIAEKGRKEYDEAVAARKQKKIDKDKDDVVLKRELQKRKASKDLAPEVKDKEVKDKDSMSDSDKAGIAMGVGKGLISARKQYLEAKQKRKEAIAKGESEAAKTRAAAGRQLIAAPVSLRKGGRVSFKDVLKAKKKMGY